MSKKDLKAFLDGQKSVSSGNKSLNVRSEVGSKDEKEDEKEGRTGPEDAFNYPQLKVPKGEKIEICDRS